MFKKCSCRYNSDLHNDTFAILFCTKETLFNFFNTHLENCLVADSTRSSYFLLGK